MGNGIVHVSILGDRCYPQTNCKMKGKHISSILHQNINYPGKVEIAVLLASKKYKTRLVHKACKGRWRYSHLLGCCDINI